MAYMLSAIDGKARPEYEPWQPMHFIRVEN